VLIWHIPVIVRKLQNLAAIILQLNGFRFYGCSLLMIYDGDEGEQEWYAEHIKEEGRSIRRGQDHDTESGGHAADSTRRSRSADVQAKMRYSTSPSSNRHRNTQASPRHSESHSHSHPHRPNRGEVNIRIVDFAHTTTGRDFVPLPPALDPANSTDPEVVAALGKGYDTRMDDETGLAFARFPPKFGERPDLGFVWGLKSVVEALKGIWEEEEGKMWEGGGAGERVFDDVFGDKWDEGELST
jgi:inositol-hexakisphosphate kinase